MDCTNDNTRCEERLAALARSNFRSRFHLALRDRQYICDKGWDVMRRHAADFVAQRLAPAVIPNDGKQTPMRGHPVFIAQHATPSFFMDCYRFGGQNQISRISFFVTELFFVR